MNQIKRKTMRVEDLVNKCLPYMPQRFRPGRWPYVFIMVLILISTMMFVAYVTPYSNGVPVPMIFGTVLVILTVAFIYGMPMNWAVHIGVLTAVLQVSYAGWVSGGIFSPRLAWFTVIPLVPFYVIGRRSGLVWLGLVLSTLMAMALATWQAWLPPEPTIGMAQIKSSFSTNTVAMLLTIAVVFLYDTLYRKAYQARLERRAELEQKREELLRASALREQFIATVSHELRTPMNAILGFNTMLLSRVPEGSQAQKILNHTRQSADHLMTVINDVLDYSQLQAGQIKIQNETFVLRETVLNAFGLFSPREQSMNLIYQLDMGEDLPQWVNSDRHRLMQILVNLLGNAIKFTRQGHIYLRVHKVSGGVKFTVEDSGIGISDDQRPRIFQRFAQAGDDIHSRFGGTGLGLSITRRLVELMGGDIGFESTKGQGSTFWVTLPLLPQAAPQQGPSTAQTTPGVLSEQVLQFLVVDDHPINRLLVKKVLQQAWPNSEVVCVENGVKALEALLRQRFDLVLMDMVMPEMDGIETTAFIRQQLKAPASQTPVLGLTANVTPQDLERFKGAGLNALMLKPFEPVQLYAQIEALIPVNKSSARMN